MPKTYRATKELVVGHKFGIDRVRVIMNGKDAERFCVELFKMVDAMKKAGRSNTLVIDLDGLLRAAV